MTFDRGAFMEFNAGVRRARAEYEAVPNACADWCHRCVFPAGTNNRCERCRDVQRQRALRAARREARA